ncbi:methyl-accepting chemotaxis protein [Carboxylicivirga sp. M1479]|uniref:methyl-accepting chemotaxis protein n=1 Tax=Carboxylicivirga sp. M1479 TaxID=2594476 RepID=UPI0011788B5C|nr:methyl-accepting chemotaxis protein [Carboxylicivirga sp. M1479]TRX72190.1 HAMP domain-containing protein [Carboxylicivirga sp. M1479]
MNIKDLKIGTRLISSYIIIVVLTILIGIISYTGLSSINNEADIASDISDSQTAMLAARQSAYEYMVYGDSDYISECNKELSDSKEYLVLAEKSMQLEQSKKDSKDTRTNIEDYRNAVSVYVELEEQQVSLLEEIDRYADESTADIERVLNTVQSQFKASTNTESMLESFDDYAELQQANDAFNEVRVLAWQFIADPTDEENGEFDQQKADIVQVWVEECRKQLEESLKIMDTQEDVTAVKEAIEGLENYDRAFDTFANTIRSQKDVQVKLREEGNSVITLSEVVADGAAELMDKTMASANSMILLFTILSAIFGVIIGFFMTRSLTLPIQKGVSFANAIAGGDLTKTLDIDQKDEIGELATAMSEMKDKLTDTVHSVIEGANSIGSVSSQVKGSANQMAGGASEQAASAEEVSSSMEEMAANIQQNTDNAIKTRQMSLKASAAMEEVASASENSMQAVNDIYKKINVVVEIAEKTDLLAINAAVEAARAGDEGKGFAVVAAEVRKLAERSQLAASEIVELADRGMKLTEESTNKLNLIVPDIKETSLLVDEITTSSEEQSSGANQVNGAIQQLNVITQQNVESTDEMTKSSEVMANQAIELKNITEFFKLSQNGFGRN